MNMWETYFLEPEEAENTALEIELSERLSGTSAAYSRLIDTHARETARLYRENALLRRLLIAAEWPDEKGGAVSVFEDGLTDLAGELRIQRERRPSGNVVTVEWTPWARGSEETGEDGEAASSSPRGNPATADGEPEPEPQPSSVDPRGRHHDSS